MRVYSPDADFALFENEAEAGTLSAEGSLRLSRRKRRLSLRVIILLLNSGSEFGQECHSDYGNVGIPVLKQLQNMTDLHLSRRKTLFE